MTQDEQQKVRLRQEIKKKIADLDPSYCQEADQKIMNQVLSLPELEEARTVCCFFGTREEIQTGGLIQSLLRSSKRVGLPKCGPEGIMQMRQIENLKGLREGPYGIMEPGEENEVLLPEDIDLILLPCLSCDETGTRLGHGGGYYDRYLQGIKAVTVALCRFQLMIKKIPAQSWDQKADIVISEEGIWRTNGE